MEAMEPGLIGRPVASLRDPNVCHIPVSRLTSFQRLQYLHQNLWKRWSQEYISELQQRSKWRTQQSQLEPDMFVLVKDDNVPPLQWKLGRIFQLHPGTDGIARVASVRTQHVKDKNLGEITVANNNKVPVVCTGDIDIKTEVNDKQFDIVIRDALCVPNLTTNLLSVSQLIKKGNRVIFTEKDCQIYNSVGELIATADLQENVYKLNIELIATADLQENVYKLNIIKPETNKCFLATANMWHRRLGHVNYADLRKMNDGVVQGLTCKDKVVKQDCVVCCEGKQSRPPFKHEGTRATERRQTKQASVQA
ncbi:methyltransferase (DUF5641) [Popillia japonica]|uniref:Methyltransferase (DUF5641) n=1 Tax=Popillia japonica TaxID=7064 RepID=A0AAW1MXA1_POPJA